MKTDVSLDLLVRYADPLGVFAMRKGCGTSVEEARKSVSARQSHISK